jgi:hypothetical protein
MCAPVMARQSKMVPQADRRTAGLTEVKDVRCRPAGAADFTFLATMLGEAAVWRPDKPTPTADQVLADARYAMYLAGWPRQHDFGLVAEQDGPLGAAWYRTYTERRRRTSFVISSTTIKLAARIRQTSHWPPVSEVVPRIRCRKLSSVARMMASSVPP